MGTFTGEAVEAVMAAAAKPLDELIMIHTSACSDGDPDDAADALHDAISAVDPSLAVAMLTLFLHRSVTESPDDRLRRALLTLFETGKETGELVGLIDEIAVALGGKGRPWADLPAMARAATAAADEAARKHSEPS